MSSTLNDLRSRGVVRDECHVLSDLAFAEGVRQHYPDRVFVNVGGDGRYGPYLHASEADARRLEAEGYRRLNERTDALILPSAALQLDVGRAKIKWKTWLVPMKALLLLAEAALVVKKNTTAEDLLKITLNSSSRVLGPVGSKKRLALERLTQLAVLWTGASRRLDPENGWGPADKLPADAHLALARASEQDVIGYVETLQAEARGALMLCRDLTINGRAQTGLATSNGPVAQGKAVDEIIKRLAKPYRRTGQNNWIAVAKAAEKIAEKWKEEAHEKDMHHPLAAATIADRIYRYTGPDKWPKKPRRGAT